MNPWITGILSICTVLLLAACTSATATPQPTPVPSPTPEPTSTPTLPLDEITEGLGYALAPGYLPEDLELSQVEMSGSRLASLIYQDQGRLLNISYPISFPSGGYLVRGVDTSPKRPDDALSEVEVKGEIAYLVRGQWSAATIARGPGADPDLAEWDYDFILSLFFDFHISQDNKVGVIIQARFSPADWITGEELVKIAESLGRSD